VEPAGNLKGKFAGWLALVALVWVASPGQVKSGPRSLPGLTPSLEVPPPSLWLELKFIAATFQISLSLTRLFLAGYRTYTGLVAPS